MTAIFVYVVALSSVDGLAASEKAKDEPNWDPTSESTFVKLLCSDSHYFRECFNLKKVDCEQGARIEARTCELQVRKQRDAVKDEATYFAKIGICVGNRLESKWRQHKSINSRCDKKENWQ